MALEFLPPWLAGLSEEELSFLRRFVLASGSLKEVAGETDAERFARNWTAMEFLKDNAVYK